MDTNNSRNSSSNNNQNVGGLYPDHRPTFISVKEAASLMGVSEGTVYQGIKDGTIRTVTPSERRAAGVPPGSKPKHFIPVTEVEAFKSRPRTTYSKN